jgi:hypothetical protein
MRVRGVQKTVLPREYFQTSRKLTTCLHSVLILQYVLVLRGFRQDSAVKAKANQKQGVYDPMIPDAEIVWSNLTPNLVSMLFLTRRLDQDHQRGL